MYSYADGWPGVTFTPVIVRYNISSSHALEENIFYLSFFLLSLGCLLIVNFAVTFLHLHPYTRVHAVEKVIWRSFNFFTCSGVVCWFWKMIWVNEMKGLKSSLLISSNHM